MSRAHLYRPIQDALGNLRTGAQVRVFDVDSTNLTTIPLFASDLGSVTIPHIFTATNGVVEFYTDAPARFRLGVKIGDEPEIIFENVDCLSADPMVGPTVAQTAAQTPYTPTDPLTGTDVQAALDEAAVLLAVPPQTAADVPYTPTTPLMGGDVQAALDEVAASLADLDARTSGGPVTTSTFTVSDILTVGVGDARIYNDTGQALTIIRVRASLGQVGTDDTVVDVNKSDVTLFTTQANRPTLASGVVTDLAVPDVTTWEDGTYLTVDVDTAGTGAKTLVVTVTTG